MSIEIQSIVENGVAINSIIVDTDNLPELPNGQTFGNPEIYPFNPTSTPTE